MPYRAFCTKKTAGNHFIMKRATRGNRKMLCLAWSGTGGLSTVPPPPGGHACIDFYKKALLVHHDVTIHRYTKFVKTRVPTFLSTFYQNCVFPKYGFRQGPDFPDSRVTPFPG